MKETRKHYLKYIFFSILLIIVLFFVWNFTIGYHRHNVIINSHNNTIILRSNQSVFEFTLPNQKAKMMNEYAWNKYTVTSEMGKPFSINGHGIIATEQIINLPDSVSTYEFIINGRQFNLENNLLHSKNKKWEITSNNPLIINVDDLI